MSIWKMKPYMMNQDLKQVLKLIRLEEILYLRVRMKLQEHLHQVATSIILKKIELKDGDQ